MEQYDSIKKANKKNEREQEAGMGQKIPFEGMYPHYFIIRLSTHDQLNFLAFP